MTRVQKASNVPGVNLRLNDAGQVIDVQLDPQEFDGPDGVPDGWTRPMREGRDGLTVILAIGLGAILAALAVFVFGGLFAWMVWKITFSS